MKREWVSWIAILILVGIASFEAGILYEKRFNEFNSAKMLNLKTRIEILEGSIQEKRK